MPEQQFESSFLERAKKLYKDKCPRCQAELVYLSKNDDYIVICKGKKCGFSVMKEDNFTWMSTG